MDPLSAINHLLNFTAPAMAIAILLVLGCRVFMRKRSTGRGVGAQLAITFLVGSAILVAGLMLLGRDGKMLSYAALVVGCATTQWVLLRGWR